MKKLFLLLALLVSTAVSAGAQTVQVATLSHEGTITSFTGSQSLRSAYEAAVDGDVITLSSGSFTSVSFEKRITVRGAGMGVKVNDSDPYIEPTILKGSFEITADGNGDNYFKLEGILHEEDLRLCGVIDAQFAKCRFSNLDYSAGKGGFERTSFINCVIDHGVICFNANMTFYACYLKRLYTYNNGSHHNIINCILDTGSEVNFNENACVVKNSIYLNTHGHENCMNNGTTFNSIWSGSISSYSHNPFYGTLESHNNSIVPDGMLLFKEGTFFQLTDEAKKYLGDDGTEVGIYGGTLPFDPTPTNPQITKFNVAPKTTADGKLSIDIEVNAK